MLFASFSQLHISTYKNLLFWKVNCFNLASLKNKLALSSRGISCPLTWSSSRAGAVSSRCRHLRRDLASHVTTCVRSKRWWWSASSSAAPPRGGGGARWRGGKARKKIEKKNAFRVFSKTLKHLYNKQTSFFKVFLRFILLALRAKNIRR